VILNRYSPSKSSSDERVNEMVAYVRFVLDLSSFVMTLDDALAVKPGPGGLGGFVPSSWKLIDGL
jgi:hypothetical protein